MLWVNTLLIAVGFVVAFAAAISSAQPLR